MKTRIIKMNHQSIETNPKTGKEVVLQLWAIVDKDDRTIIQVYSKDEPISFKKALES
jgi:hypothetical protein